MSKEKKKFIQAMHMKKGALHKQLHVPQEKKIPESKLKKAEHSSNKLLAKRAHLAETLKHLHHKTGGSMHHKHHSHHKPRHKHHMATGGMTYTDGPRHNGHFGVHHGYSHDHPVYYGTHLKDGGHMSEHHHKHSGHHKKSHHEHFKHHGK